MFDVGDHNSAPQVGSPVSRVFWFCGYNDVSSLLSPSMRRTPLSHLTSCLFFFDNTQGTTGSSVTITGMSIVGSGASTFSQLPTISTYLGYTSTARSATSTRCAPTASPVAGFTITVYHHSSLISTLQTGPLIC
jgi:hypothetical protein